jgi:hypothetical protein
MKTFRSQTGPFQERPFFSLGEIESLCLEELKRANLFPSSPEPIRIERFIEKRFGVSPCYEDLPDDVLGFTRFGSSGVQAIVVSRSLAEDGSRAAERRINTTLAHEAGHGLLHSHLFVLGAQPERLFGDEYDPKTPKILCRDEAGPAKAKYDGRWWEFQANQTIGALLLPRPLAERALAGLLKPSGIFGTGSLDTRDRGKAAELLSKIFHVNPAAAQIRVDQLFPLKNAAQLTL